MRGRRRAEALGAAAVAACLLAACSLRSGPRRPSDATRAPEDLRIWIAPIVRWEPGGGRAVSFALENATNRTLAIAGPDPVNARVEVFAGPEPVPLCGVEPRAQAPAAELVELAPGDRVSVRVDLTEACAGVPPGEYRYEVSYRAPTPAGGAAAATGGEGDPHAPRAFSGTLATFHGELVVEVEAAAMPEPESEARRSAPRAGRRPPAGR